MPSVRSALCTSVRACACSDSIHNLLRGAAAERVETYELRECSGRCRRRCAVRVEFFEPSVTTRAPRVLRRALTRNIESSCCKHRHAYNAAIELNGRLLELCSLEMEAALRLLVGVRVLGGTSPNCTVKFLI